MKKTNPLLQFPWRSFTTLAAVCGASLAALPVLAVDIQPPADTVLSNVGGAIRADGYSSGWNTKAGTQNGFNVDRMVLQATITPYQGVPVAIYTELDAESLLSQYANPNNSTQQGMNRDGTQLRSLLHQIVANYTASPMLAFAAGSGNVSFAEGDQRRSDRDFFAAEAASDRLGYIGEKLFTQMNLNLDVSGDPTRPLKIEITAFDAEAGPAITGTHGFRWDQVTPMITDSPSESNLSGAVKLSQEIVKNFKVTASYADVRNEGQADQNRVAFTAERMNLAFLGWTADILGQYVQVLDASQNNPYALEVLGSATKGKWGLYVRAERVTGTPTGIPTGTAEALAGPTTSEAAFGVKRDIYDTSSMQVRAGLEFDLADVQGQPFSVGGAATIEALFGSRMNLSPDEKKNLDNISRPKSASPADPKAAS